MIALGLVKALGLRVTVILACLQVLLVTAYGVAQDLGQLAGRGVGRADRAAANPVDVNGAPHRVIGDPPGALDVPGMAGTQA